MMKKCSGCGVILQNNDETKEGYVTNINSNVCTRCFRIKNYNEYQVVVKDNKDFENILKKISKTNDLVVLLVDLFNIPKSLEIISKNISNDILLVYTKKDLLPLKINDLKLLDFNLGIKTIDSLVISSNKNYNLDLLYEKIKHYKKSNNVYIIGFTNAGKSTLINKMIYNYSDNSVELTTSNLQSTTLDLLEVKLNDELTLIDTPGVLDNENIINMVDGKMVKKIIPKKEIKPITYQVKEHQFININDLCVIESSNNNLTIFVSNNLEIKRTKNNKVAFKKHSLKVKQGEDLVITGLGFIKIMKDEIINIYTLDNVLIYTRNSLI